MVAFVAVAPLDLEISRAWAAPDAAWGRWIARYGEAPTWLSLVALPMWAVASGRSDVRVLAERVWLQAMLHPLFVTQGLKGLWGRVRFRDLMVNFVDYSPVWSPGTPGGGESFPSGHTAMAAVSFVWPAWVRASGGDARLPLIVALGWTLAVGHGRVVAGAHYATDVLASTGIGLALAFMLPWRRPDAR